MSRQEQIATKLPQTIVWDQDGKEMIYVAGGEFTMGGGQYDSERPTHQVRLDDFYIDRYPVTNEEYKRFIDDTGRPAPYYTVEWADADDYNWNPDKRTPPEGKEKHPVVLVSWEDARAYAAWAGKRLPTEAEWERAARGADGRRWPWGDEFARGRCNTRESGLGGTAPVDAFTPACDSPDGVADMIGNVWEWTSSLFRPYPYDANDGRESYEAEGWRVLRGGSWSNDLDRARCTARLDGDFLFFKNVGFRCAVSADKVERRHPDGLSQQDAGAPDPL